MQNNRVSKEHFDRLSLLLAYLRHIFTQDRADQLAYSLLQLHKIITWLQQFLMVAKVTLYRSKLLFDRKQSSLTVEVLAYLVQFNFISLMLGS